MVKASFALADIVSAVQCFSHNCPYGWKWAFCVRKMGKPLPGHAGMIVNRLMNLLRKNVHARFIHTVGDKSQQKLLTPHPHPHPKGKKIYVHCARGMLVLFM